MISISSGAIMADRPLVVVMQSFIMNSHEVFIHIHQGCFAGTGAIVRLPQCQWGKPDGYGKISQCITTTKHSKAKTVCIFLGIFCTTKAWTICQMFETYHIGGFPYPYHSTTEYQIPKQLDCLHQCSVLERRHPCMNLNNILVYPTASNQLCLMRKSNTQNYS